MNIRTRPASGKLALASLTAATALTAVSAAPLRAQETETETLRVVAHAALRMLDPVNTTAYITRNHGYFVYDTLFSIDADFAAQPQMVESWEVSEDGLTYSFALRDGLMFHDGSPVTAEDAVASIRRWAERDLVGRRMIGLAESLEATGEKSFEITLSEPFGAMIDAMAKPSSMPLFVMPAEIASAPASEPITDYTGSGPFVFVEEEFQPGVRAVYRKNEDYVPRDEAPSGLAGGKVVKVDRVEYLSFPDTQTTVNAMVQGEVDMLEAVSADMMDRLEGAEGVTVTPTDARFVPVVRFNWLQPPFDDVKARRAALHAISQIDFMAAQIGDPDYYEICGAMFGCGTALATETGAVQTAERADLEKAKALLEESDYDGETVVVLHPTDLPSLSAIPLVMAQALQQVGFNAEVASTDWATYLKRRNLQVPVDEGGWSVAFGSWNMLDLVSPLSNLNLDTRGAEGYAGWSSGEEMAGLIDDFAAAGSDAEKTALAEDIQALAYEQVFFIPLGTWNRASAWRDGVSGRVESPIAVYWNIDKN